MQLGKKMGYWGEDSKFLYQLLLLFPLWPPSKVPKTHIITETLVDSHYPPSHRISTGSQRIYLHLLLFTFGPIHSLAPLSVADVLHVATSVQKIHTPRPWQPHPWIHCGPACWHLIPFISRWFIRFFVLWRACVCQHYQRKYLSQGGNNLS